MISNPHKYKPKKLILKCCKAKLYRGEKCKCPQILTTGKELLDSYKGNKNTGCNYEKCASIAILLGGGLTTKEELPETYKEIQPITASKNIKGVINLTQIDNIGGTSDIGIVYFDKETQYFSITEGKGKLSKCICNPSGSKYYNLIKTKEIEETNVRAFQMAINHRKNGFGEIPNKKWKRITDCPGSKYMCEFLASEASKAWMSMNLELRKEKLTKMLDLDHKLTTNASGIIYWNKNKNRIEKIYKWELNINLDDYLTTYSDGIYVYHGTSSENFILKTQVKYNNGIIEGMSSKQLPENWNTQKSSNYISSWNCVAPDLTKIFKMEEVNLVE